jgi:hypothetical protein
MAVAHKAVLQAPVCFGPQELMPQWILKKTDSKLRRCRHSVWVTGIPMGVTHIRKSPDHLS